MKKKLVYVSYEEGSQISGVVRKIQGQCNAFEEAGIEVKRVLMLPRRILGWKIWYRMPFTNINPCWKWDDSFCDCDYMYIRYPMCADYHFLRLLKKIKTNNPTVKIILELHSGIMSGHLKKHAKLWYAFIKDSLCRRFLKRYVNVMTILSDEENIKKVYGIDTLTINNGFDFSVTGIRSDKSDKSRINLMAVSTMAAAHGYDRLIDGMNIYYSNGGKRDIVFRLFGNGQEYNRYCRQIEQYGLQDKVILCGFKTLEELHKYYSEADVGISALALHRTGIKHPINTVMKNKEYVAVGLPVVGCAPMDLAEIDGLKKYVLEVPDNEEPIDMNIIIDFYDSVYSSNNDVGAVISNIRKTAEGSLTYRITMKSVIDYINSDGDALK